MAKKISQRKATTTVVVRAPAARRRAPAPIVVAAPRSAPRRRGGGGGHRGGGGREIIASVIAGAAVGFIEKQGLPLPAIPVLGKKGTIALLAYLWRRNGGPEMARDVAMVAAGLSGYQFTKDGRIDGDDDE